MSYHNLISKSQYMLFKIPFPGISFIPSCWIWIKFLTIVVHVPRMCHYLDPRWYLQGQGQTVHITIILLLNIIYCCYINFGYFTQLLQWLGRQGPYAIVPLTWKMAHESLCRMIRNGPLNITKSLKKAGNGPLAKISSQSLLLSNGVSWSWLKVISPMPRSQCTKR